MTWNHNCVFLIRWLGRGLSGREAVRKLQDKRWDLPQRMWRIQNLSVCWRKWFCTTAWLHTYMRTPNTLGWQLGTTDEIISIPIKTSQEHTKKICLYIKAHTYLKGEARFFGKCTQTRTHARIFPSRLFWTSCFLWPFVNVAIMFRCRTKSIGMNP